MINTNTINELLLSEDNIILLFWGFEKNNVSKFLIDNIPT